MFRKDDAQPSTEIETIIGPSVKVEGDFVAAGDVVVEGTVVGNLRTERGLRVGENAKILANVAAGSALIAGEIQGNVKVRDNLELTATAKIFGDVKTRTISIAAGAVLMGKCTAGDEKRLKPDRPADRPLREGAKAESLLEELKK